MKFTNLNSIKEFGFLGFKSVSQLWLSHHEIPNEKGVYLILNTTPTKKYFLVKGVGGYFKGTDPNVNKDILNNNWVDNSIVVYIGKAGGKNSLATLKKRLKQYLDFGKGKAVGHKGGRYIWQLQNHSDLLIAWKVLKTEEPSIVETELLKKFDSQFGKLPFANLRY